MSGSLVHVWEVGVTVVLLLPLPLLAPPVVAAQAFAEEPHVVPAPEMPMTEDMDDEYESREA